MFCLFFFNDTATTEIYTLSLHDALPIFHSAGWPVCRCRGELTRCDGPRRSWPRRWSAYSRPIAPRSEEHTSELQSHLNLVCRLLLEKKKRKWTRNAVPPRLPTAHPTLAY